MQFQYTKEGIFYAKEERVTGVQLNVICCLSKMRVEELNVTGWPENSCDVLREL
jgi:hypothetical protein